MQSKISIFLYFIFLFYRQAISNFAQMVKPGGILVIDHRNYDHIIDTGSAPTHNIYYNVRMSF